MPIHQSFSWWCFAGKGLDDDSLLAGAKSIGYEAVELVGVDLFPKVKDHGLIIASHPAHQGISNGLNDPREHDRIEREIKEILPKAIEFGIPNLITFSGERKVGYGDLEAIRNCALGLRRVVREAEQAGVTLCMELLNSKVDHRGYQCDTTQWGSLLCDLVDSPKVKLLYDIYHMQIMEGDIIRTVRDFHSYFSHYHTAGNPGRRDMDDTQELNYRPIMQAISDTGYTGFVGHEFIPKGPDMLDALSAAFELCNI
jgi:hydroxypyruvate isomerase